MARKQNPKLSYNPIPDYETDWMQDPTNDNKQFSGESVQAFLKQELRGKAGYFDEKNGFVRIFTDKEHSDLYELFESDPTDEEYAPYADYLLTSFRAPAKTYAELGMTTDGRNIIPIGATGNFITLTPIVKDTNSDANTGESVIVRVEIKHLGNVVATVTKMGTGGETMNILIDQYLMQDQGGGTYNVKVTVQGSESLATASGMVVYEVVAMKLSVTQWDYTKPVTNGQLEIPYTLQGATSSVRYISAVVNGTPQEPVQASSSGQLTFPVSGSGKQTVVLQAYVTDNDGNRYASDALVYEYVVGQPQTGTVLLAYTTKLEQGTQDYSPVIRQYGSFAYQLATPEGTTGTTNVTLTDTVGGTETTVKTVALPPATVVKDEYQPTTVGTHTLKFKVGDTVVATLTATVGENVEANISEADGYALKLSAAGRSNDETAESRQTWADNGVQAQLAGFAWNPRSGWNGNALVIPPGATVTIPLNVLSNAKNGGAAVSIDFETTEVTDENGQIATMGNALVITASTAKLRTTGGVEVETRFFEGDRQHLTFITNPTANGEHNAHIIIVNNGVMERAATYSGQVAYNGGNLVIAPQGCTVKLYGIRMYNNFIIVDKAFCNWAVDSGQLLQIAQRNDILTNEALDAEKVNEKLPVMVIECSESDMNALLRVKTKAERKATKATVNVQYTDLIDPSKNFTARGATLQCQGTSSLGYPRKNWNLYFGVDGCTMEGVRTKQLAKGFAYSFKTAQDNISGKESAYVPTFCLKADYAESSGSHNTGVARIWNQLMYDAQVTKQADLNVIRESMPQNYYNDALNDVEHPLRTRAQNWANANDYPSDVRTTIDGFPIVLFWKHGSIMECLGQYNFNNDKSTEDVFGFTHLTRNENTFTDDVECWECLDSAKDIALFKNITNWDSKWEDSFEARYPDKNTNTTRLKALCTALSLCYQANGDYSSIEENSNWTAAKAFLDMPKVAAYFVYISRFGAVDQTVKNTMLTSEDGQHWFFINYDNDTIFGIDNAGLLINDWTFLLGVDGVYAGDTSSVLWNCLRNDSQFMRLVNVIDRALISAHLTYDELCQMFDEKQCGQWPERIYNINGAYKYIGQGAENILKLQGSRKSYRHWWLGHRMEMFDNIFGDGSWESRSIQLRMWGSDIGQGVAQPGTQFTAKAAADSTYGWGDQNNGLQQGPTQKAADDTIEWETSEAYNIGNLLYIYNASNLKELNLSGFATELGSVNVEAAVDNFGRNSLKKLTLGDGEKTNDRVTGITGLGKLTNLEALDIRGFQAITSLDAVAGGDPGLSALVNLNTLDARDSGLTSFRPAPGIHLTSILLPTSVKTIELDSVSGASIDKSPESNTPNVTLRHCAAETVTAVLSKLNINYNRENLTVIFPASPQDATVLTDSIIEKLIEFGQDESVAHFSGCITKASGTITGATYAALEAIGITYVGDVQTTVSIDSSDLSFNVNNLAVMRSGYQAQFNATVLPTDKGPATFRLYDGSNNLITPDANGMATYQVATLNTNTGLLTSTATETPITVKVTAVATDGSESAQKTVILQKTVTIGGISVEGTTTLKKIGQETLTIATTNDVSEVNVPLTQLTATLKKDGETVSNDTYLEAEVGAIAWPQLPQLTLNVKAIPDADTTYTLTATARDENGNTFTQDVTITIRSISVTDFNIGGPTEINAIGVYDFPLTDILPADANTGIASLVASVSEVSGAAMSAIVVGTEKVELTVEQMPTTQQTATLTVTATMNGGSTIVRTKNVTLKKEQYVDLGLPSGLRWATGDIVGDDTSGYAIGEPGQTGAGFSWGNIHGHANGYKEYQEDEQGNVILDTYTTSPGGQLDGDITSECDAAVQLIGNGFRMPTKNEFVELTSSCNYRYVTIGGVKGLMLTSKLNGKGLFLAARYFLQGETDEYTEDDNHYWTTTNGTEAGKAVIFNFNNDDGLRVGFGIEQEKYKCFSIRPVIVPTSQFVDLGLPSGLLWAKGNIVKDANGNYAIGEGTDYGAYFSWGNIDGHNEGEGYDFSDANYNASPGKSLAANIASNDNTHDAALARIGGCRMPTKEEFQELYDNTDTEWVDNFNGTGVAGRKFMKKADHDVFIFFPAAGCYNGTSLDDRGYYGRYWSASFSNSAIAYNLDFSSGYVYPQSNYFRRNGCSVRAVQ